MLKKSGKLIIKLLCLTMCTSLVPTTMAFAKEKSNKKEIVQNVVQTTGSAVSSNEKNTIVETMNNEPVNSSIIYESGFKFDADTGTIEEYYGTDANVVIPSSIGGVAVEKIKDSAFFNKSNITSVTISYGVKTIESSAFYSCTNLKSISIPNSVTSIGSCAFYGCSRLESINIPDSVTSMGTSVFYKCINLTNATISSGLSRIEDNTFFQCENLKSIIIPDGVTSIGHDAFAVCDGATSLIIPKSVKSIEYEAFKYCRNLKSITIPNSVTSIGPSAFAECNFTSTIIVPDSVTSMERGAFSECENANFYVDSEQMKYMLITQSNVNANKIILRVKAKQLYLSTNDLKIQKGKTSTLIATVLPSNTTNKEVRWTTNDRSVVTVDQKGQISAVGTGTAVITCSTIDGSELSAACVVTVIDYTSVTSVKLNTNKLNWIVGRTGRFTATVLPENATNKGLIWTTSNNKVATIDQTGYIKAVGVGTAIITCTAKDDSGKSATCFVTVTTAGIQVSTVKLNTNSLNWTVGRTGRFTATVLPTNAANKGLTWTTSNNKVATIDQTGYIKAIGAGTCVITCRTNDGSNKSATCLVKVSYPTVSSISLNKTNASIGRGKTLQLIPTIMPADALYTGMLWRTENEEIATVNEYGNVTAVAPGTTNIVCMTKEGNLRTASCKVTVTK